MSTAVLERPGADQTQGNAGGPAEQIVSFRLADEEYGVEIMKAQEIIMIPQITRMPEVPDYICGLINLRGSVIPIIDIRKRFGLPAKENDEQARIIVVNVRNKTIGMVVDAVTEVLRISNSQIEPPPSGGAGIDHEYIRGIVKRDDKLIILLRIDEVLTAGALTTLKDATAAAEAGAAA